MALRDALIDAGASVRQGRPGILRGDSICSLIPLGDRKTDE
jgi:hypothetical protein